MSNSDTNATPSTAGHPAQGSAGNPDGLADGGKSPRNPKKPRKPLSKTGQILYRILGVFFVGCGFLGILLPVWPTTIFLILASAVFMKSSPGLYAWLHRSRVFGPYLQAYRDKTGISIAYKAWTLTILWLGLLASGIFAIQSWPVRAILGVIGIAVTIHILTIKTRRREEEVAATDPIQVPGAQSDDLPGSVKAD